MSKRVAADKFERNSRNAQTPKGDQAAATVALFWTYIRAHQVKNKMNGQDNARDCEDLAI